MVAIISVPRELMPMPVIYCRDLHVCRLGGAANAICEVGHKATTNLADISRLESVDVSQSMLGRMLDFGTVTCGAVVNVVNGCVMNCS